LITIMMLSFIVVLHFRVGTAGATLTRAPRALGAWCYGTVMAAASGGILAGCHSGGAITS
jgi:hypothetical protein